MTQLTLLSWAISVLITGLIAASRKHWSWFCFFLIIDFLLVVVLSGKVL